MSFKDMKLVYFRAAGRAETTRLLLHAAGVKYEEVFVSKDDGSLEKYKKEAPYNLLPILEVDGNVLAESACISRYLARELGYMGKNNLEAHKIEEVQALFENLLQIKIKFFFAKSEEEKAEHTKKLNESFIETMGFLETILKKSGTGFVVGDKISLAEFVLLDLFKRGVLSEHAGPLDKFPLLKANVEKTAKLPNIASYTTPK